MSTESSNFGNNNVGNPSDSNNDISNGNRVENVNEESAESSNENVDANENNADNLANENAENNNDNRENENFVNVGENIEDDIDIGDNAGDLEHDIAEGNADARDENSESRSGSRSSEAEQSTSQYEQVGDFVSMIMNHMPDESSIISGPCDRSRLEPLPSLDDFPSPDKRRDGGSTSKSNSQTIHSFLTEARSILCYYDTCLRLIEASTRNEFQHWDWLDKCLKKMTEHPIVSEKMKLRYFIHNKNNTKTFRLIQKNLKLPLDNVFYMGKMNLLHIACDSGWAELARELVHVQGMNVNQVCPSRHMKPGNLTPLMLASCAGHSDVVKVLLEREDLNVDQKDKEGFTALFHTCNHGTNRVGDPHGYFRRLWSWDLSEEQLQCMERIARDNARDILQLLVTHGSNVNAKDNTGATVLFRASTVENFSDCIEFLVEAGCRVTHNILNWTRVKNPDCVTLIQSELCTPKSLVRQARSAIWNSLRQANKITSFDQIASYDSQIFLPNILVDYLNCR
eukprot:TRINITY_DN4020_c0_g1_i1.p1 TRINITY_DN4020_c0_g1~~TRINITY_DN4020_c0_g1_i1.p1  ORF type:complete len:521 (+),score=80.70 TRINITY_DN4020_c0_g1_i1:29-1564(+)